MKRSQTTAPLFERLLNHAKRDVVSFHTPGHKNGSSIEPLLSRFTGKNVYRFDVTVFPEVDSLHDPTGPIKKAQELMADAYGVKHSFFLVNGSSSGNMAMFLAFFKPGDSVILSRNIHKSVLSGIILSGVWPIWIQPPINPDLDIVLEATKMQVEEKLHQFPEAKGVFLTSPTYNGIVTDLKEICELVHRYNRILMVDEAHGAHLKFHPDLPISATEAGADLCVQSTHKMLSALSQGSVLHYNTDKVDLNRLRKVVSMLQTTSPNYLILASLDLARRQMVTKGRAILDTLLGWLQRARQRINRLDNFFSFTQELIRHRGYELDPTKLTINVKQTGLSGYEVSQILNQDFNIQVDCMDSSNLIAILGVGSKKQDLHRLLAALEKLDKRVEGRGLDGGVKLPPLSTEMVILPHDVFFSYSAKRISLKKVAGHISAQVLTPYPPGIPVLLPGERITPQVRDYLLELAERKIRLTGQEAKELKTIKVVRT